MLRCCCLKFLSTVHYQSCLDYLVLSSDHNFNITSLLKTTMLLLQRTCCTQHNGEINLPLCMSWTVSKMPVHGTCHYDVPVYTIHMCLTDITDRQADPLPGAWWSSKQQGHKLWLRVLSLGLSHFFYCFQYAVWRSKGNIFWCWKNSRINCTTQWEIRCGSLARLEKSGTRNRELEFSVQSLQNIFVPIMCIMVLIEFVTQFWCVVAAWEGG